LVCLPPSSAGEPCQHPFAMIQDTGASFGPRKLDLDGWRNSRIWSDANTCDVNMSRLPYAGATFAPSRISEDGRKFFVGLIGALSDKQVRDLIETARFAEYDGGDRREERIAEWVAAFRDRIRQIATHPPCP
ncbi:MAG TPA: hypothetical protein VGQ11_11990, partial [Candidatus Acidoferrales bacterium]|nr:hypothetical protein [Candidatus Acidoferrales bacterium]